MNNVENISGLCIGCIHKGVIEGKECCRRNPPSCIPLMKQSKIQTGQPDLVIFGVFPPCPPDGQGCGEWNDEKGDE